jgi:glycerol uptake facilitator-like aquaporin
MVKLSEGSELAVISSCNDGLHLGGTTNVSFPCANCKTECLSELLGTYLLVFIGPASIVLSALRLGSQTFQALVFTALSFGATVTILILLLGKYSGTIINPALTTAVETAGLLKRGLFLPFLLFQTLGGLLAGLTLQFALGPVDPGTGLGSTKLAVGQSPTVGILLEAIGTFTLASSALIASTKIKTPRNQAILVGSTLFVLILLIGPFTGAGFNPARSLGPSLASGYLDNLYVYLAGPIIGASAAGLLFRGFRKW